MTKRICLICGGETYSAAESEPIWECACCGASVPGNIVCERTDFAEANIPQFIVKHSPGGFEWGYGGSGPADLALNILALYIGRELAEKDGLYQDFKWKFIATLPLKGGVIKREEVLEWLRGKFRQSDCDLADILERE